MITARLTSGPWTRSGLYSGLLLLTSSRLKLPIDQTALRSKIFGFALVSVLVCDNLWFLLCDIPSPGSHGSLTCTKWFKFNCRHISAGSSRPTTSSRFKKRLLTTLLLSLIVKMVKVQFWSELEAAVARRADIR